MPLTLPLTTDLSYFFLIDLISGMLRIEGKSRTLGVRMEYTTQRNLTKKSIWVLILARTLSN